MQTIKGSNTPFQLFRTAFLSSGTWVFRDWISSSDAWRNITISSNFIPYNNASRLARYKKVGERVSIEGAVSPKVAITDSSVLTPIFSLPLEFRPTTDRVFLCQGSGKNTWLLTVQANGNVQCSRYGTTEFISITTSAWLPFEVSYEI